MAGGIEGLKEKLSRYPEEAGKILDATEWIHTLYAGKVQGSGEPYIEHPLAVASILIDMQMDAETVIAGLLHDLLEETNICKEEIGKRFGPQVEDIVEEMTKMSILKAKTKTAQEAETIRKTLFAMTKDIRVIIIKLADKLHIMNTLQFLPEERRRAIAEECMDIYAPLADRLGMSWMKIELEDLCLKQINPRAYNQIKEALNAKRSERAAYLAKVKEAIYNAAREEGYSIEIASRAKHFYSIYQKMKRSSKDFDQIYDLFGIRIICQSVNECYGILGLVHRLWLPIEGRFKDYIAMPKANQYQSLHTTVMCFDGKLLEIQIRTEEMHTTAEYGIAAHWAYKKNPKGRQINPDDLLIINKLKSWSGMEIRSNEYLEEIKRELLKDSIFVFTPKGNIIELPAALQR
jgi:GTP pyrophosphokinase